VIITRYLTREITTSLLAVITVLLVAFLSQQMVRYLNYVAIGKIPTNVLLKLVGFEIPYLLAFLLPLALYLSILLAYGRLYADNEMAIFHLGGFGEKRMLRLTFIIASVVTCLVLFLMLWINPFISAERQKIMQSEEATLHLIQTLTPGRFQASPDGRHVMYVEKLSRDHQRAENVFLAKEIKNSKATERNTWMLVFAHQGYQAKDKKSPDEFFVTRNGYRYEGMPGQNDYKIIHFEKYAVRIPQNEMRITHIQDEALSTSQLLQDYVNPKRAAEFQWRFSIGVSTLLLALLAVPLSSVLPRKSRFLILLPAILVYIVYINLLFISRHWVEQGVMPVAVGMWWVHGLVLLLVILTFFIKTKSWIGKST
jgi:lipopolysaccharide export system permease protein